MGQTPLSAEATVIVDANVFFAIGQPSNPHYERFRAEVQRVGVVVKLPQRVVGELGGPETERIQTARDEGWAEIVEAPPLTDGDAITASDIARRTIASETGQPEHEVEKTDTILAGIAIQYLKEPSSAPVIVVTDDGPAKQGIEAAVHAQGYDDSITVCGLSDIIGDEFDDDLTVI